MTAPARDSVIGQIFAIMERDGVSSVELARRIGVYPARISEYARGIHSPSAERLEDMARALDAEITIRARRAWRARYKCARGGRGGRG